MKTYKLLFKLTSRSRPEKFFQTIENIRSLISKDCAYRIHCTLDSDDTSMYNPSVVSRLEKYPNTFYSYGRSKNKIEAINRDMELSGDWDILINMSDDMRFTVKGFDTVIKESFDNLDTCLHLPDGNQNDKCITLAILGKEYYNRFNYIYHPDYVSLWCDMEMTEQSKLLGKYKYVDQHIYKHMHPAWGLSQSDAQYRHTESFYHMDEQTYLKRKAAGFAV